MSRKQELFDIIIIGAGGAGLSAMLSALEEGHNVLCVSKVPVMRSHTAVNGPVPSLR